MLTRFNSDSGTVRASCFPRNAPLNRAAETSMLYHYKSAHDPLWVQVREGPRQHTVEDYATLHLQYPRAREELRTNICRSCDAVRP